MRILRTAALALAALVLCGTGTAAAASAATSASGAPSGAAASPAACTGTLDLTVSFSKPSYPAGSAVTVLVKAVNCTAQTLNTHLMPYGKFADAAGNLAPGCPVIDPLYNAVTIGPNATYTTSFGYQDFAGCQATQFIAYDNFYNADGSLLAAGTASVPLLPPVACHVVYTKQGEWQGGFSAGISIANTGQSAVNGWTLTFSFGGDQKAGNVWGGTAAQTGPNVSIASLSWDGAIAPGATINVVGMTGTWSTANLAPGVFALNGVTCT